MVKQELEKRGSEQQHFYEVYCQEEERAMQNSNVAW